MHDLTDRVAPASSRDRTLHMTAPDPTVAVLRQRAARLRRSAHQIEQSEWWSLRRRCGGDTWVGPSATAFEAALAIAEAALRRAEEALRAAASRLEREADTAASTAALAGAAPAPLPAGREGPR